VKGNYIKFGRGIKFVNIFFSTSAFDRWVAFRWKATVRLQWTLALMKVVHWVILNRCLNFCCIHGQA